MIEKIKSDPIKMILLIVFALFGISILLITGIIKGRYCESVERASVLSLNEIQEDARQKYKYICKINPKEEILIGEGDYCKQEWEHWIYCKYKNCKGCSIVKKR